jgi:hypothetical protein
MAFEKDEYISTADMAETEIYFGKHIIATPVIGTSPIDLSWNNKGTIFDDSEDWEHIIKMAPEARMQLGVGRLDTEGDSYVKVETKLNSEPEWTLLSTPDDGEVAQYYNTSDEFAQVRIQGHYVDDFGPDTFSFQASISGYGNPAVEGELIKVINPTRDGYSFSLVTRILASEGRLGV